MGGSATVICHFRSTNLDQYSVGRKEINSKVLFRSSAIARYCLWHNYGCVPLKADLDVSYF